MESGRIFTLDWNQFDTNKVDKDTRYALKYCSLIHQDWTKDMEIECPRDTTWSAKRICRNERKWVVVPTTFEQDAFE